MSVSSLVLVAAAASAYVVPLRARAPLRSTLRAQAIDAGAQNATEFSGGLVSDGAAAVKTPSPLQQLSDAFGLKDASILPRRGVKTRRLRKPCVVQGGSWRTACTSCSMGAG